MNASLVRITAVARATLREVLRERVLLSLVFYAIMMALAALLAHDLTIRQEVKVVKDVGLAGVDVFGTLVATFVGVSLVSRELERRSAYVILAKPLTRGEFVFGKFAGFALALGVYVASMTLLLYGALGLARVAFDPGLLGALLALYLATLIVAAIAVAASTVASTTLATILTFSIVLAGRYSDVIANAQQTNPEAPTWLLRGLYIVLPSLRHFDFKDRVVYGAGVAAGDLLLLTAYAVAYCAVVLALAAAAFRRRDLT
jgi:ABC-type transport system involved in multi-copper enzyme maturation permease subunit